MSNEFQFAPPCAELQDFAAKILQTVENDRENSAVSYRQQVQLQALILALIKVMLAVESARYPEQQPRPKVGRGLARQCSRFCSHAVIGNAITSVCFVGACVKLTRCACAMLCSRRK